MAQCRIPLRVSGLVLLLSEEQKQRTLRAYQGDILWSILASVHAMSKSKLKAPSYSDMVEQLYGKGKAVSKQSNQEVIDKVEKMLSMF